MARDCTSVAPRTGGPTLHTRVAFAVIVAALSSVLAAPLDADASGMGTIRICTGCAANAGDLAAYDYVILHSWEYKRMRALKAANPRIKVLVYKSMSATYAYSVHDGRDDAFLPAGVGYVAATALHPDWFARDTSGRAIEFADYRDLWLMDVGNEAYQQAWLDSVGGELRRYGWDGVMIDEANASPRWHTGDRTVARYPTDAAWASATRSFLARVGPALKREGFLVLPNIYTDWPNGPKLWRDWLQFTSGGVQEYWTKWGTGADQQFADADWTYRQQFLPLTESLGKIYLAITYAPLNDVRSQRYARASFLVDWDGGPSALLFQPTGPEAQPAYAPEWTSDVGRPAGARQKVGASVVRRDYTRGVALVNMSRNSAKTVDLGGWYLTPQGLPVSSLTLQPMSGMVLRLAQGVPGATALAAATAAPVPAPDAARPRATKQTQPTRASKKHQRHQGRVVIRAGTLVTGRVLGHAGSARVTIYWKGAHAWHFFARARTDVHGRFRAGKRLHHARPIRLRAIARLGAYTARSRVLRVRVAN